MTITEIVQKITTMEFAEKIVIPLGGILLSALVTWKCTKQSYQKKLIAQMDLEADAFYIYNTGTFGVVAVDVGLMDNYRRELFRLHVNKNVLPQEDPLKVSYGRENFILTVESSLGASKNPKKLFCFIKSADGRTYKNKAHISYEDYFRLHENFFGRDVDEYIEGLPF